MIEFIILGQVPGTSIQIGFTGFLWIGLVFATTGWVAIRVARRKRELLRYLYTIELTSL